MSSLASLSAAQFSVSSMPFASVIPTGAPRGFVPSGNLWRGVEGPRRSVLCHTASRSSLQTGSRSTLTPREARRHLILRPAKPRRVPKNNGARDNAREELPVAEWSGMNLRGPSTSRYRLLVGTKPPRRCGRDDRFDRFSEGDGMPRAKPLSS